MIMSRKQSPCFLQTKQKNSERGYMEPFDHYQWAGGNIPKENLSISYLFKIYFVESRGFLFLYESSYDPSLPF